MTTMTHRILFHDAAGFFGRRELTADDRRDADGHPVTTAADEAAIAGAAGSTGLPVDELRSELEAIDVAFVPKEGFEATGLEPLTDDAGFVPADTWAAFHPIR